MAALPGVAHFVVQAGQFATASASVASSFIHQPRNVIMSQSDPIWSHLLNWQHDTATVARLVAAVLLDQGYTAIDPDQSLLGADGRLLQTCRKNGEHWGIVPYFASGQQTFETLETQLNHTLGTLLVANLAGIVIVSNQEMRLSERERLEGLIAPRQCDIFHLERLAIVLSQPRMAPVTQQYVSTNITAPVSGADTAAGAVWGGLLGSFIAPGTGTVLGALAGAAIAAANAPASKTAPVTPAALPNQPVPVPDQLAISYARAGRYADVVARIRPLLSNQLQAALTDYSANRPSLLNSISTLAHLPLLPPLLPLWTTAIALLEQHRLPDTAEQYILDQLHQQFYQTCGTSLQNLRLTKLELRNFRGFTNLTLDLHEKLTVLVAPNGMGKTTLLDAARLALWPFVNGFDLAHATAGGIAANDVHSAPIAGSQVRQFPASVAATAKIGDNACWRWMRSLENERHDASTMADDGVLQLAAWANLIQAQTRQTRANIFELPVLAYYGCNRTAGQSLWQIQEQQGTEQYVRTFGYRNCLSPAASYPHFANWFVWICQCRDQELLQSLKASLKGQPNEKKWQEMVQTVQQAIDDLLHDITGWHTLDYNAGHEKSIVLQHKEHGILNVALLSDGIRGIIALAGDLAYRCIKLNPHLGAKAARQATGVVLIDELELHLHPAWQQRIIEQLRIAFPKIQFILSTHSPQVLGCVPKECIRIIHLPLEEEASAITQPDYQTRGVSSADILAHIMDMDSIPDVPEARQLSQYRMLIARNEHQNSEGTALFAKLLAHFGKHHPEITELQRLIDLEAFKRKMAAKKAGGQ